MTSDALHDDRTSRLARYRQFLSADEMARLVASLDRPRLPAIRINTLKITVAEARRSWPDWYGWDVREVPFCPAGWQIERGGHPVSQTLEHDMGFYYVQDAASMLPAEMFSPQDAPLILDLAAAPGGKTTHLASRFVDRGVIVANDTSIRRIAALRSNLQTWGAMGALVTSFPGERFGRWFPETFDKVLLDAPCSGDTLRATTGGRARSVSDRERQHLCQRQDALLESAFLAVRPGGEIVYSTCTLAPEENEAILDALLAKYPGAVEIAVVDRVTGAPGLATDGTRSFHPSVRHAVRLWPHAYQTSGFFAALIRKARSVQTEVESPPYRPHHKTGLTRLPGKAVTAIIADWQQAFGFDWGAVIEAGMLTLWEKERSLYAIPERLLAEFGELPHAAAGFLAGQRTGERFVPSHELVTRYASQFAGSRITLDEEQAAIWLQGRDLRAVPDVPYAPGVVVLLEDERGRFIGRGKLQRDRIRNLLPRRVKHAP